MDEVERSAPSAQSQEQPSPRELAESAPDDGKTAKSGSDTEASAETGNESVDAGSQVMGRLPRTRPQRRSGRRPATTAKSSAAKTKRSPSAGTRQRAGTSARPRNTSSGARARSTAARRRPAETATRTAARKRAPGAPQLAVDVALGAAKLPLKVTAAVTRSATRLIGRGLRLR